MSERAVDIANAAIRKVFKNGGETTVTLPKYWYLQITATRLIGNVTEIRVLLYNIMKMVEEPLFFKEVGAVDMHVSELFSLSSYIGSISTTSLIVSGRFKLKVKYITGDKGVTVANIEVKKA